MGLRLYDTALRDTVVFEPRTGSPVTVYACGPTVYDFAHIGNFRSFLFFDLVHRYLAWRGHEVRFVMNLTDVDDKVIEAADRAGVSICEYTQRFADALFVDARALGMRSPASMPRATEHIEGMIDFIERLMERGHAYKADDGAVYFSVKSFPAYGRLRSPTGMAAGARVAHGDYEKEEDRDFALWKSADEAAVSTGAAWESPWGIGRPGWHLECSVMSIAELGAPVDLHLGGEDLVFPHHENEIAQSEAAIDGPFVRHWLHVKHLFVEGRKMSKSLGNFISVHALLGEGYDPASIRHILISSHYRGELNFTRAGLEASKRATQRLLDFDGRLRELRVRDETESGDLARLAGEALTSFRRAMDDDFNSAEGLAALFVFVGQANALLDRSDAVSAADRDAALETLVSIDSVLGLIETAKVGQELEPDLAQEIEALIEERAEARSERDFARADEIRDELMERGVALEDGPEGTRWKLVR